MSPPTEALVEHFFRHESANLIAVLSRAFGVSRIELIEDTVQSAIVEAVHSWRQKGPPDQPAAWIYRVAKNRLLDQLRREKLHRHAMAFARQTYEDAERLVDQWLEPDELPDSLLRMMFVCCHPQLDRKSQLALTLKILCGFGVSEIARGLLLAPEAVKKRIQRGKQFLAKHNVSLDFPPHHELAERREGVHETLYLLFNEGYSTSQGKDPIRQDICEEAARLCYILYESHLGDSASGALLALMLFHAARFEARIDEHGQAVLLEEQDRSVWDQRLITIGEDVLLRSAKGQQTRFHFEAMISLQHCRANSLASTNWPLIVSLYNALLSRFDSPVYALNRAIAFAQAGEADTALEQLAKLRDHPQMQNYYLLECARARILEQCGHLADAASAYRMALSQQGLASHEIGFVEQRLARLESQME